MGPVLTGGGGAAPLPLPPSRRLRLPLRRPLGRGFYRLRRRLRARRLRARRRPRTPRRPAAGGAAPGRRSASAPRRSRRRASGSSGRVERRRRRRLVDLRRARAEGELPEHSVEAGRSDLLLPARRTAAAAAETAAAAAAAVDALRGGRHAIEGVPRRRRRAKSRRRRRHPLLVTGHRLAGARHRRSPRPGPNQSRPAPAEYALQVVETRRSAGRHRAPGASSGHRRIRGRGASGDRAAVSTRRTRPTSPPQRSTPVRAGPAARARSPPRFAIRGDPGSRRPGSATPCSAARRTPSPRLVRGGSRAPRPSRRRCRPTRPARPRASRPSAR